MLDVDQLTVLKRNVSKNLRALLEVLDVSQMKFAKMTGVSEPALSNYIKEDTARSRVPPFEYLVGICAMQEFKDLGLELTTDLLKSEKFNPRAILAKRNDRPSVSKQDVKHGDFLGNYLCYYYDQSKPVHTQGYAEDRGMRYGVISVYDDCEGITGEVTVRALGAFFKEKDFDQAVSLKAELDLVFRSAENLDQRNKDIEAAYDSSHLSEYDVSAYEGEVTFSDHHAFIHISSSVYGDSAHLVLHSPQKRLNTEYLGGLGIVSSVSRGMDHVSAGQKIILTKFVLKFSAEEIGEKLRPSLAEIDAESESMALCEFCRDLYSDTDFGRYFDDADKCALVNRRMEQLIRFYIEKNAYCVCTVTEEEDRAVYEMIQQSGE